MKNVKKKIYVAMSGGVDSSVAAALLKEDGHDVTGVYFKPWAPKGVSYCPWQEDMRDAKLVAAKLDISFKVWDLGAEYKKKVADYMIREYRVCRTPNPDILCNKEIKFGIFLQRALAEGADFVATGHYVRSEKNVDKWQMLKGVDNSKDQSYFLYSLDQEQLSRAIFPIGGYQKIEVRKLAKKFDLPVHDKKDSQGVCFVGELAMDEFLKDYIKPRSGNIVNKKGEILGQHPGASYYTIGQRHKIGLSGQKDPMYVTEVDVQKNKLTVGPKSALENKVVNVDNFHWISGSQPGVNIKISAKIRYGQQEISGQLYDNRFIFDKPVSAAASGQAIVFYSGDEILGGGIIQSRGKTVFTLPISLSKLNHYAS